MATSFALYREFSRPARSFLVGSFLLELAFGFLWTLQNLYVRSVGFGEFEAGVLLASSAVGVLTATFPSASLYERLGPRRSLSISCFALAVAISGLALSTTLPMLVVFAFASGAAVTLHRVVSAPFVVSESTPAVRTHLFQAEFATHAAAMAVGPLLAGFIAARLEGSALLEPEALRWALIAGASTALIALLPFRALGDRIPDLKGRTGSVLEVLRRPNRHLWTRLTAPHLFMGLGAGITIPFINLFFTDRFDIGKDSLGLVMSTSSAAMVVGTLLTPLVVARLGLVKATILTEALSLPFFLILAFTGNYALAIGAFILRSALMNLAHPIWRNLIMEITPAEWRAPVNSMSMLGWNLGWGLSNIAGGRIIEVTGGLLGEGTDGYAVPMLLTIGLYSIAILLEATLFWRFRELGRRGAR